MNLRFNIQPPTDKKEIEAELRLDDDGDLTLRLNGVHAAYLIYTDGTVAERIEEALSESIGLFPKD